MESLKLFISFDVVDFVSSAPVNMDIDIIEGVLFLHIILGGIVWVFVKLELLELIFVFKSVAEIVFS